MKTFGSKGKGAHVPKSHGSNGHMMAGGQLGDASQAMLAEAVKALQEGKPSRAEGLCRKIIKKQPKHFNALHVLGIACRDLGKPKEGVRFLKQSIALAPDYADTHNNLGTALMALERYEEAIEAYWQAIELQPESVMAHDNLGLALSAVGDQEKAIEAFQRVLKIDPEQSRAISEIASLSRLICDWRSHTELRKSMVSRAGKASPGINPYWLLSYTDDPALMRKCAHRFAQDELTKMVPVSQRASKTDDRIRIAYVSADFREHPVAHRILPVIEAHDRDRFDIIGISFGEDDGSPVRKELVDAFDQFHDVRTRADRDIAQLIADRKVHIAVDLTGYTDSFRPGILASRPAPIQVNYLGFTGTMAADHIDYIIADRFAIPKEHDQHFDETLVRLPECTLVSPPQEQVPDIAAIRSEAGLPSEAIVFCAFNDIYQIIPEMFDIWMRLLTAIPGSVLWLMSENDLTTRNLRQEAIDRGVDGERLMFAAGTPNNERARLMSAADLFLDTVPQNSHWTALQALGVGVPVIAGKGRSFPGRLTAGLLRSMRMEELVAETLEDYERLARGLARDPEWLARIRGRLANVRLDSPPFNPQQFTRDLENAYGVMVKVWSEDRPISPIALAPSTP